MGETDNDALARLVIAQERFEEANEIMNKVDFFDDAKEYEIASRIYAKRLDELRKLASDLGLTISSRCKLVVPKAPEKKSENKFSRFDRTG
jgi:P27 family predicted phage terminase small subunit